MHWSDYRGLTQGRRLRDLHIRAGTSAIDRLVVIAAGIDEEELMLCLAAGHLVKSLVVINCSYKRRGLIDEKILREQKLCGAIKPVSRKVKLTVRSFL